MGSFVVRCYLAEHGNHVTGAIIAGTGRAPRYVMQAGYLIAKVIRLGGKKRRSKILHWLIFGNLNAQVENPETPVDFISRDKAAVQAYLDDPLSGRTVTVEYAQELLRGALLSNSNDVVAKTRKISHCSLSAAAKTRLVGITVSSCSKSLRPSKHLG